VSFYLESSVTQDCRKLQSKVTVRKEDNAQAARSYTAARSTSAGLMP
jgi:hypothetical protein